MAGNVKPKASYGSAPLICEAIYYRGHFALAVVMNPWACLTFNSAAQTRVFYFDSMPEQMPLATRELFAAIIWELDTIRQGTVMDRIDVSDVSTAESRITFEPVPVSLSRRSTQSPSLSATNLRCYYRYHNSPSEASPAVFT